MPLRLPIRFKIFAVTTVLLLAALGTYLVIATRLFRRDKLAYVYDLNGALVESLAEQTRATLTVSLEKGRLLARELERPGLTPAERTALADERFRSEPDLIQISIVAREGVASYHNRAVLDELALSPGDLPPVRKALPLDALARPDDVLIVNSSLPPDAAIVTIAAPHGAHGHLVLELRHERLLRLFGRFSTHQTALVDRRGVIVAHPDAATVVARTELASDPLVRAAVATGAPRGVEEYADERGRVHLGAYAEVGLGGLRVVTRIERAEALRTGDELVHRSFLFGAAILCAVLIVTVFFSRLLTSPIRRLRAAAEEVGRGNLDVEVRVRSRDEIGDLGASFARMAAELKQSQRLRDEKQRLEKEMEIAAQIQTSILPRKTEIPELDVAARMVPASSVGGDYYDVLPTEKGGWIGIGDVAGHGVSAGVVMLMVQACIAALVRREPDASPRDLLRAVNRVVFENVRERMGLNKHVTLSLLRYDRGGRIVFAGAHLELLICRAATGRCEVVPTRGTWIGIARDIDRVTVESTCELQPGDLLVLYTDGILEAANAAGEELGLERLAASIEERRGDPTPEIADHVLARAEAWRAGEADDDLSIVVLRRVPPA